MTGCSRMFRPVNFLRCTMGGNVMWGIINMFLSFWSIPMVIYLIMPALIISVLLLMEFTG